MCSGFPENAKCRLYKSQQTYNQALNQHKLVFTVVVDHPVSIPTNKLLAEKAVEPVWAYYGDNDKFDGRPFEILRSLIDILETNCETEHIRKQEQEVINATREKQFLYDDEG